MTTVRTTLTIPAPAVVMMMGAPGAGKTTLARALAATIPATAVISYDDLRKEVTGNESDQSANDTVRTILRQRVAARCALRYTTIVDGTHTLARARATVLDIGHRNDLPVIAVILATPCHLCHARQSLRERQVPPEIIDQLHADMLAALPAVHTEGFDGIHLLVPRHRDERRGDDDDCLRR